MYHAYMSYQNILFGYASAEAESSEKPELLLDGYFDPHGYVQSIMNDRFFIILGYKGTGKTSLGKHFVLSSHKNYKVFSTHILLDDFSHRLLKRVSVISGLDDKSRFRAGWKQLLWLLIFQSYGSDQLLMQNPLIHAIYNEISTDKLGTNISLNSILNLIKKLRIDVTAYDVYKISLSLNNGSANTWPDLVASVESNLHNLPKPQSKHFIFIDGLDDIVTLREERMSAFAALLNEVRYINNVLSRYSMNTKIVLLFRTDIYELIPDANKNKLRNDYGKYISWFEEGDVKQSPLVRLANMRASLSLGVSSIDVFDKYFPRKIAIGYEEHKTINYLLYFTRHTPRDFLQLLEMHKEFTKGPKYVFTSEDIEEAINKYSREYFLPEIKDELAGLISASDIQEIFQLMSIMRKRDFMYSDILAEAERHNFAIANRIQNILQVLYEHSAIGHIDRYGERNHITFKYRNRDSGFSIHQRILLHKGLFKALNIRR